MLQAFLIISGEPVQDKWENLCGDQGPGGSSDTTKTPKAIASASSEEVDITGISGGETSKAITTTSNEEVDITGCSGNKTPEAIATASSGEVHKTESNATETPEAIATASIDEIPITELSSASEEIFSDSTTESSHGRGALTCREMVLEVLILMKHSNPFGSEFPAIASFIELKNGVPWSQDFRNKVGSELQMLVSEGLVEKVVLGYRITAAGMEVLPPILSETEDSPVASTSAPVIPNSFQQASEQAAQLIAEAERATFLAHVAARETCKH